MTGYSSIPEHMRDAMQRYIENGIEPGGFLSAVLSNDLMGSLRKGDEINQASLLAYARFLYNDAPSGCYGSHAAFVGWCESGGIAGIERRRNALTHEVTQ